MRKHDIDRAMKDNIDQKFGLQRPRCRLNIKLAANLFQGNRQIDPQTFCVDNGSEKTCNYMINMADDSSNESTECIANMS